MRSINYSLALLAAPMRTDDKGRNYCHIVSYTGEVFVLWYDKTPYDFGLLPTNHFSPYRWSSGLTKQQKEAKAELIEAIFSVKIWAVKIFCKTGYRYRAKVQEQPLGTTTVNRLKASGNIIFSTKDEAFRYCKSINAKVETLTQ